MRIPLNRLTLSLAAAAALAAALLPGPAASAEAPTDAKFEQDRAAILGMAGEYHVDFDFKETVAVAPGYETRDPYHAEATEFVEVVEDRGDFISLQHVLVLHDQETGETRVVKHWRQDWTYQDTQMNAYRGHKTWERVSVSPGEAAGAWSQAVYQVDDSPRYEGLGRWTHDRGVSTWTSEPTWRPLPRREYTKRSDYHVLAAVNTHIVSPAGWVHAQDNRKLVLDESGEPAEVLAHEAGLNVYRKAPQTDFSAGRAYWADTHAFWQDVRELWRQKLAEPGTLALEAKVDDQRLHQVMFAMAQEVRDTGRYDAQSMRPRIAERIEAFIKD